MPRDLESEKAVVEVIPSGDPYLGDSGKGVGGHFSKKVIPSRIGDNSNGATAA
jgi:hypothetical protein